MTAGLESKVRRLPPMVQNSTFSQSLAGHGRRDAWVHGMVRRWACGAALIGMCVASQLAWCAVPHRAAKRHVEDPWEHAVKLRQQLEDMPEAQRTRERFEAVLDAYRAIYHDNPAASKAPAAVAAVGEVLAEKGRVLQDANASKAAIGQYEFLRKQYPGSPQVANAALAEGDICRQDLKDTACAVEKFKQVVAESPGSSYAEQAALELKELEPPAPTRSSKRKGSRSAGSTANARLRAVTPAVSQATPPQQGMRQSSVPAGSARQESSGSSDAAVQPVATSEAPGGAQLSGLQGHRSQKVVTISGIRHWSNPTSTRIAIDLGGEVEYEAARVSNPDRIFFDLHGARLSPSLNGKQVEVIDDGYLRRIRAAQFQPETTRVVLDVTNVSQYSAFLLPNPWRLIIDVHSDKNGVAIPANSVAAFTPPPPAKSANDTIAEVAKLSSEPSKVVATAGPTSGPVSAKVPGTTPAPDRPASQQEHPAPVNPTISASSNAGTKSRKGKNAVKNSDSSEVAALPHAADPDSAGGRSLVRALGLKVGRIVIDAGHGGHDSGTLGPGGIQEKDVVLDVALRVGKLLHQRLGAEIVYTRDDDTFIPLETRTAIANKAQADLFLSIHANSSREPEARGVETYYLNFTSDPGALDVAARENAVSSQGVHQLSNLVRQIALKDKIDESREFAADVDAALYAGLKSGNPGLKDRGVKKAPFVVLIGAQMPSILAEISFLTNPDDAEQLRQGAYRERIAEALDAGVERYLKGLSGLRPSEKASARSAARDATATGSE
jgi:N-acetylmuramoyl-L-alanine amidase